MAETLPCAMSALSATGTRAGYVRIVHEVEPDTNEALSPPAVYDLLVQVETLDALLRDLEGDIAKGIYADEGGGIQLVTVPEIVSRDPEAVDAGGNELFGGPPHRPLTNALWESAAAGEPTRFWDFSSQAGGAGGPGTFEMPLRALFRVDGRPDLDPRMRFQVVRTNNVSAAGREFLEVGRDDVLRVSGGGTGHAQTAFTVTVRASLARGGQATWRDRTLFFSDTGVLTGDGQAVRTVVADEQPPTDGDGAVEAVLVAAPLAHTAGGLPLYRYRDAATDALLFQPVANYTDAEGGEWWSFGGRGSAAYAPLVLHLDALFAAHPASQTHDLLFEAAVDAATSTMPAGAPVGVLVDQDARTLTVTPSDAGVAASCEVVVRAHLGSNPGAAAEFRVRLLEDNAQLMPPPDQPVGIVYASAYAPADVVVDSGVPLALAPLFAWTGVVPPAPSMTFEVLVNTFPGATLSVDDNQDLVATFPDGLDVAFQVQIGATGQYGGGDYAQTTWLLLRTAPAATSRTAELTLRPDVTLPLAPLETHGLQTAEVDVRDLLQDPPDDVAFEVQADETHGAAAVDPGTGLLTLVPDYRGRTVLVLVRISSATHAESITLPVPFTEQPPPAPLVDAPAHVRAVASPAAAVHLRLLDPADPADPGRNALFRAAHPDDGAADALSALVVPVVWDPDARRHVRAPGDPPASVAYDAATGILRVADVGTAGVLLACVCRNRWNRASVVVVRVRRSAEEAPQATHEHETPDEVVDGDIDVPMPRGRSRGVVDLIRALYHVDYQPSPQWTLRVAQVLEGAAADVHLDPVAGTLAVDNRRDGTVTRLLLEAHSPLLPPVPVPREVRAVGPAAPAPALLYPDPALLIAIDDTTILPDVVLSPLRHTGSPLRLVFDLHGAADGMWRLESALGPRTGEALGDGDAVSPLATLRTASYVARPPLCLLEVLIDLALPPDPAHAVRTTHALLVDDAHFGTSSVVTFDVVPDTGTALPREAAAAADILGAVEHPYTDYL